MTIFLLHKAVVLLLPELYGSPQGGQAVNIFKRDKKSSAGPCYDGQEVGP